MKGLSLLIWILIIFVVLIIIFSVSFVILKQAQEFYKKQEYRLELFSRATALKIRGFDINRLIMSDEDRNKFGYNNFTAWINEEDLGSPYNVPYSENPFYKKYGNNTENIINCIRNAIISGRPCVLYSDLKVMPRSDISITPDEWMKPSISLDYYTLFDRFLKERNIEYIPINYEKDGITRFICNYYARKDLAGESYVIFDEDESLFIDYEHFQPFVHGGYIDNNFKNIKLGDEKYLVCSVDKCQYDDKNDDNKTPRSYTIVITDAHVDENNECKFKAITFKNFQIGNSTDSAIIRLLETIKDMPDYFFKYGRINLDVDLDREYTCTEIVSAVNEGLWEWNRNHFYDKQYIKTLVEYGVYFKKDDYGQYISYNCNHDIGDSIDKFVETNFIT
ncbi:MAG: hypothetical protein QXN00_02180, partial [Candidatus Aenigmatarchaeota archaeon]